MPLSVARTDVLGSGDQGCQDEEWDQTGVNNSRKYHVAGGRSWRATDWRSGKMIDCIYGVQNGNARLEMIRFCSFTVQGDNFTGILIIQPSVP